MQTAGSKMVSFVAAGHADKLGSIVQVQLK
jgi:hypothetical protein